MEWNNYTVHYQKRCKVPVQFITCNSSEEDRISRMATRTTFVTAVAHVGNKKRKKSSKRKAADGCPFHVSKLSKDLLAGGERFEGELCGGSSLDSLDDRSRSDLYSLDRSCYVRDKPAVFRA